MSHTILVIEDERTLARNIKTYLARHHYEVHTAGSAQEGLQLFESLRPDVVLLDLQLPDQHGLEVLTRLRTHDPRLKVIMMTAYGNVQIAVEAMKAGAYDYLGKPLVLSELKILLDKAVEQTRLEGALSYYQTREASASDLSQCLGASPPMQRLKAQIQQVLEAEQTLTDVDLPAVLITGETGTGKELVARALHYNGTRQAHAFVEVNCAALPEHLLEAELFGYEQGAFTDAKGRKLGLFEAADGGSLFLDEIGDLALSLQAKLLRSLEGKVIRRLGGLRDRKINVRIIAATNQPLEEQVRQGKFRADLYFRLRVIHLPLPPLRERGPDILLLARHFLQLQCRRYGKPPRRFSAAAEAALLRYPWPGNVRELRNVIEQTVLLSQQEVIEPAHLPLLPEIFQALAGTPPDLGRFVLPPQGICLEEVERDLVQQALAQAGGNVTQAAKLLGLSRDTLRYRMEKYQLKCPSAH
jgi:two-component system, NtrC family, response regulator AtoC